MGITGRPATPAPTAPAPAAFDPSTAPTHTVRLEPVGIEMEVAEGETVLEAAFRQGIALMHGCKEGQCSACKSLLVDGDVELRKYSTFALNDEEREQGHVLLCRTLVYGDCTVELLNFDEELLRYAVPVRDHAGTVTGVEALTHDIRRLTVALDRPLTFHAGQYVDLTVPAPDGTAVTRAYSMASTPADGGTLAFIIKRYPEGAFSALLDGALAAGTPVTLRGPFGTCFRRRGRTGPLLLVGGGSGMSPLLAILDDLVASGEGADRPVRFFYGARARRDLFLLDHFAEVAARLPDFRFVPALSHAEAGDGWDGEAGFVHEVVARHLRAEGLGEGADAYACGPPPMIDAVIPVLHMAGLEPERVHFDKFTQAVR